ncbi:MAG: DUF2461 domain-containing protein [Bacteroidetes bacterium]|nr:DUF2461 domain-containing protein [Bacteroidota bacterium]
MQNFTPDFLNFLTELSLHNDRDWFNANKARFKKNVEEPFVKFIGALIDRVQTVDPRVILTPKDAVHRIYRDIRFSNDKTPYKTHMSAVIAPGGRKGMHESGMYVQLGHEDFRIYGGAYMPEKAQLQNIREAIAADPGGFSALIGAPAFVEKFGQIHGEENKRLPAELMEAAEKQPLIFKKSFYFFHVFPAETVLRDDLPDVCMEYYLAGKPVGDFLGNAGKG